jgi:dimethylhistidine N-methyltransferase
MSQTPESTASVVASPIEEQFRTDVLTGLSGSSKALSSKYLYDQRGSELFDAICELDEYYPTRTELAIMEDNVEAMGEVIGEKAMLVEYGSGSSLKTRLLLEHLRDPAAYVPVDISEEHLLSTAELLRADFPSLNILPVFADFTQPFDIPAVDGIVNNRVIYFPGSTIGNFTADAANELLASIAEELNNGDSAETSQRNLLIGIDLVKDIDILEAAYNDREGVTAEFNLNLLDRMNRELDAKFDRQKFLFVSFFNTQFNRIEAYLESTCKQSVAIGAETISLDKGERIRTEYSHKYSIDGFAENAKQFGFELQKAWTDPKDYFALLDLKLT